MDYETDAPPEFDFEGFWQARNDVFRQWRMWTEHGIMPFAGGYYDQPSEWRHDVELCDAIYSYWSWHIRQDVKGRKSHG